MTETPRDLRLQALFLIFLTSSVLVGFSGLILDQLPKVQLPGSLAFGRGGSFVIFLAVGVLLVAAQKYAATRLIPRPAAIFAGVAAVTLTFVLAAVASWAHHDERTRSATRLAESVSMLAQKSIRLHEAALERMLRRWQSLEFDVPPALLDEDSAAYFKDISALTALYLFDGQAAMRWQATGDAEYQRWGSEQLAEPRVQAWLRSGQPSETRWLIPDKSNRHKALLSVTASDGSDYLLLASLDLNDMLSGLFPSGGHRFDVAVALMTPQSAQSDDSEAERTTGQILYGQAVRQLPEGLQLHIGVYADQPGLSTLRGQLPLLIILMGLVFSYLLIISRSLLSVREDHLKALNIKEQEFRSLFTQSPDAIFGFDTRGFYREINPQGATIVEHGDLDTQPLHYRDIIGQPGAMPEDDRESFETAFGNALAGHPQNFSVALSAPAEEPVHYNITFIPIVVDGKVTGAFGVAKDVTRRVRAEASERVFRRSLDASRNAVLIIDVRSGTAKTIYVNAAYTKITGYTAAEMIGQKATLLDGPGTDPEDLKQVKIAVRRGVPLKITLKSYRQRGTPFWNQLSMAPVRDESGRISHFAAIMTDISEQREQENRLAYQATHDALTGLPNRALFNDRLRHDFELAKRQGHILAVLFVDLDEFKPINDTLGHKVGDLLLRSVTERLSSILRPSDTLARFGGDEFVLLLPNLATADETAIVAERVIEALERVHRVNPHELHISASVGIAVLEPGTDAPEKLIQQADMAMYKAKQMGRNTWQRFTGDLDSKLQRRVALKNDLQDAIEGNQLHMNYQPILDAQGELVSLEALVRWHHPVKGAISPAQFIPIAEETGQITALSRWVLEQSCSDALQLINAGLFSGRLAVNLSPTQFHRSSFLATLQQALTMVGLPPRHLELELTEGILMKDTDGAVDILHALRDMGIATAIDDFGTGFSSLSYLRALPIDKIKIDRSFIKDVTENEKDAAVCKGVIALANELDLIAVAEGIETRAQFDALRGFGCELFQGYWFARPMAVEPLQEWLRAR